MAFIHPLESDYIIRASFISLVPDINITVRVLHREETGDSKHDVFRLIIPTALTKKVVFFRIGRNRIEHISAELSNSSIYPGTVFGNIEIGVGTEANYHSIKRVCSGYISSAFPIFNDQSDVDYRSLLNNKYRVSSLTSPAAGLPFTLIPLTGEFYYIDQLAFTLTTSGVVGNRSVKLILFVGGISIWESAALGTIPASTVGLISAAGSGTNQAITATNISLRLPRDLVLIDDLRLRIDITNIKVGDTLTNGQLIGLHGVDYHSF